MFEICTDIGLRKAGYPSAPSLVIATARRIASARPERKIFRLKPQSVASRAFVSLYPFAYTVASVECVACFSLCRGRLDASGAFASRS